MSQLKKETCQLTEVAVRSGTAEQNMPGRNNEFFLRSSASVSITIFLFLLMILLAWLDGDAIPIGEYTSGDSQRLCRKVLDFGKSVESCDVLLLGSSLILNPAISVDGHNLPSCPGSIEQKVAIHDYDRCDYIARSMRESGGRDVRVKNLSLPGAMISDDYLILNSTLRSGKIPQLVVLGVAPRDFVSNVRQNYKNSYIYRALGLFDDLDGGILSRSQAGRALWLTASEIQRRLFLMQAWTKNETDSFISGKTSGMLANFISPQSALSSEKLAETNKNGEHGGSMYWQHYNPPNYKLLSAQNKYLEGISKLAFKYGFELVVVDMPLRSDNLSFMDDKLYLSYQQGLEQLSKILMSG